MAFCAKAPYVFGDNKLRLFSKSGSKSITILLFIIVSFIYVTNNKSKLSSAGASKIKITLLSKRNRKMEVIHSEFLAINVDKKFV